MRNGASSAKPSVRLAKMNNAGVRRSIERIHIETESTHHEYLAIPRNAIKDVARPRARHTEHDISGAGIYERSAIVLRHESDRSVIDQVDPVHSKRIGPAKPDFTGGSVKDIQG